MRGQTNASNIGGTVSITNLIFNGITGYVTATRTGNIVSVALHGANITAPNETFIISGLPEAKESSSVILTDWSAGTNIGLLAIFNDMTAIRRYGSAAGGNIWLTLTYIAKD